MLWDGLWSVPLAYLMFVGYNYLLEKMWPDANMTGMSPEYINKLIYAGVVMVGMNLAAWFAIFFNFHRVWDYYLCESGKEFITLTPKQKIWFVLLLYFAFYFSGLLLVLMPV
jgi:hypothetical protein